MTTVDTIINKVNSQISPYLDGMDRQMEVGTHVSKLEKNEIEILHEHFKKLAMHMREANASDIEIGGVTAQNSIWFRIQGIKTPQTKLGNWPSTKSEVLCMSLLNPKQMERLYANHAVDFSYTIQTGGEILRWRATLYFDLGHLALNMRAINATIYPYHKLGFHPFVSRALSLKHEKQGIILLTGITGSGKSTTMDSIIDANNQTVDGHIIIIGDPIEYIHRSKRCIVRHREVGKDVKSFKDGAIQALRQDPDIIVVGEMRDPETIMSCLEISDTGHKVFSTLHTGSSVETIDRIVAETPTREQERVRVRLADQLKVVISQKLIPGIDGKFVLAKEVLVVSSSVRAAIRNRNIHEIYQMISEGGRNGQITMEQDLVRLARLRLIDEQAAIDNAINKNRIKELFSKRL